MIHLLFLQVWYLFLKERTFASLKSLINCGRENIFINVIPIFVFVPVVAVRLELFEIKFAVWREIVSFQIISMQWTVMNSFRIFLISFVKDCLWHFTRWKFPPLGIWFLIMLRLQKLSDSKRRTFLYVAIWKHDGIVASTKHDSWWLVVPAINVVSLTIWFE